MTNRWLEPTRLSRPCANDRHDPSRGNYPKERSRSATPRSTLIPEALSHQRAPRARSGLSERLPAPHRTRLDEYRVGDLVSYQNNRECSTTIAGKARIAPVSIPPRA